MSPPALRKCVELVALFVLLAIVGLRPLIAESFHTDQTSITAGLPGLDDPMVATTIVIDLVILIAGAIVIGGRTVGRRYRITGLEWGAVVLVIAAVVSSLCADAKRPAIVGATDLVASVVLAIALVQLFDARWKLLLGLGVVVASGVANSAESIDQRVIGFEQTERNYMENRDSIWSEQGVSLDAPQVRLFEQRMRAREASGYFAHSNVAGGYLLIPLFVVVGGVLASVRRRGGAAETVMLAMASCVAGSIAAGVVFSSSVAAISAGIGATILLGVTLWARGLLVRKRVTVFAGGWVLVLLVALGITAYGIRRGGLPQASLDFRWKYWTASARMFLDYGLLGVGAENFGDYYVRYKPIESPEEVKNPHNFGVQFATEFGVLGLAAALLLLGAGTWRATSPVTRIDEEQPNDDSGTFRRAAVGGMVLACFVFGPRTRLLSSDDPNFVFWMTAFPMIFWLIAFGVTVAVAQGALRDERRLAVLGSALSCGLLAFLVQDTVNFALFVPGARTTFFALAAMSIAIRMPAFATNENALRQRTTSWLSSGLCLVAAILATVSAPAALRSERDLRCARSSVSPDEWYASATQLDPLDATAPTEHARWLAGVAGRASSAAEAREWLTRAIEATQVAIRRAPARYGLWRLRAACFLSRGLAGGGAADAEAAVSATRRAIELYPTRPESYTELGDCLVAVGTCEALADAREQYAHALTLDSARPAWEEYRRLTAKQLAGIQARIKKVDARRKIECKGDNTPVGSQP